MKALQLAIIENGQATQITTAADFRITLNPEAEAAKAAALEAAGWIEAVGDIVAQNNAANVVSTLRAFARDLEKSRVVAKEPFLVAGKLIDNTAREEAAKVNAEIDRLTACIKDFQTAEFKKAEEIRKEQERIAAEIQKQRDEEEAKRKAAEEAKRKEEEDAKKKAEEARKEAERLATEAKGKKAREQAAAAQAEADKQAAAAQKLEDERIAREFAEADKAPLQEILPAAAVAQAPALQGGKAEMVWDFEVTDIRKLYEFAGERFVKLAVDRQSLLDYFNWPGVDPKQIPGIRAFEEVKVSIRAKRG